MATQSGVSPEVVPLPNGGGGIRSIGDKFSPDLHTGTGNYAVPLWFPPGPGGLQPELSLGYSTGMGNGPFGMGWQLPGLSIRRQTDRGLPEYDSSDTFLLDGAELAPLADNRYRQHYETQFYRVERIGDGWEVRDKRGRRFLLGTTAQSRIEDNGRIAAWLVERAIDPNGNEIRYGYRHDSGQCYLETVGYSIYTVRLAYAARPDPFTDRRFGFDVRTALRCQAITYEIAGEPAPFRRYDFEYLESPLSRLSLLQTITYSGEDGGVQMALPPLRLQYTRFEPSRAYQAFHSAVDTPPPRPASDTAYDLVDLYATCLPGVLEIDGPVRRYWPNRGEGVWGSQRTLDRLPATLNINDPGVAIADMEGNGTADLLMLVERPLGYYRNEPGQGWTERARFKRAPTFDPRDGEIRLVDLDGDGIVDLLRSSGSHFYIYFNRGRDGWEAPIAVRRIRDLSLFPDLSLNDPRVKLADMTGDGLMDMVLVHDGRIDYWPHYGRGRFGPRVTMTVVPTIGRRYDPDRLFLSDVNGDGAADVIYADSDRVHIWINQSGNALAQTPLVRHTPRASSDTVQMADMYGTGTAGILWSYPLTRRDRHNYKYLDLTGGERPYLLSQIDNGIGLQTTIAYRPSTWHRLAAEDEGRPWQSALPFAVPVVTEMTRRDLTTGTETRQEIRYDHGYYDGRDRAFRGFGRVAILEPGDEAAPSLLSISEFHQGAAGLTPGGNQAERNALSGRLARVSVFDASEPEKPLRIEENLYAVRQLEIDSNGVPVLFPHLERSTVLTFEGQVVPTTMITELTYDDFGNATEKREQWQSGADLQTLVTVMRYAVDTNRWMLNLPLELWRHDDSGQILQLERYYYDGDPFVGLPLGEVTNGNMKRRERMVISDAGAAGLYGAQLPDFADLGFHRITAPDGTQGWAANLMRADHDNLGNVVGRQDGMGAESSIVYDADGIYPVRVNNALGQLFESLYDPHSTKPARLTEPNGHETRYKYDPVGRLTAMIKPGDSDALPTIELTHLQAALPHGLRARMRQRSGEVETVDSVEYFNGQGQLIQKRSSAEGNQVLVDGWRGFNPRGWEAERTSPFLAAGFDFVPGEGQLSAQQYRFTHDALGRIVETVTPDGRPSRITYGPGTVSRFDVSDTDDSAENVARGHFDTPREELYDAQGRLLEVREMQAGGALLTTRYTYDPLGRLTGIVDARGVQLATYVYNLLGRKIGVQHADAGSRRAAFNARGDLVLSIDALGQQSTIEYDDLSRRTATTVAGALVESYHYDVGAGDNLIGRLARVEDEAGEQTFSYSPRGLVSRKDRTIDTLTGPQVVTVQYRHDAMERITGITYPDGGTAEYVHDERGQLSRINGIIDQIHYDALNRIIAVDRSNGVTDSSMFDPLTFYLQEMRVDGPARPTPYYHVAYTHDAVGNPLTISDNVNDPTHPAYERQFTYDARYQLTGATGLVDGAPFDQQFRYDAGGNFERNDVFSPETLTIAADSNRLRGFEVGGVETELLTYNDNGSVVAMRDLQLNYDARGRLVRIVKTDGTVIEILHDYEGQRVRKRVTSAGVTRETLYVDRLYDIREGGATRHIYQGDVRVASVDSVSGQTLHYHRDWLGNPVLMTDGTGNIVQEAGYFPFGGVAYATGAAEHIFQFLGNEFDAETGLIFARSRYYDPQLGRFITPDLFTVHNPDDMLSVPLHLNSYVYAGNNPLRFMDDEGAWWKWVVGALVIAVLVVATVIVGIATGGAGFAFGILLAASIGSALGAGVGTYAAATSGGDPADGFLFGALVGGAAGAAGFAAGAGVGALGISGAWGTILAGAAQGAIIGAANGAISGYAGGAGSWEDILIQAGIGFLIGAVVGGAVGYLSHSPPTLDSPIEQAMSSGSVETTNSIGQPITQTYQTAPGWHAVGRAADRAAQSALNSLATPVGANVAITVGTGVSTFGMAAIYYDWDDIRSWILETFGGEEEEVIIPLPYP